MLLHKKKKKNEEKQSINSKKNRFLITVNVLGSCGPIKFVVNEGDKVTVVIDTALKLYAREGRLPVLGPNVNEFLLYPTNPSFDPPVINQSSDSRIFPEIGSFNIADYRLQQEQNEGQVLDNHISKSKWCPPEFYLHLGPCKSQSPVKLRPPV